MNSKFKPTPKDWKMVLDAEGLSRCISRMSYEILEKNGNTKSLAIVGIRTAGEFLAQRIQQKIAEIDGRQLPLGVLDITLYRDDISQSSNHPLLRGTELPFVISGTRIILVDDVLFTGRTVRSALDAIIDFGRPTCVELAVLIDRGHRELPIRPDYVGKNLPTNVNEQVHVSLNEIGFEDGVYLSTKKTERRAKA